MAIELNADRMLGLRLLTAQGQSSLSLKEGKPIGPVRFDHSGAVLSLKEGKPNGPSRFKEITPVLGAKVGKQNGITGSD